MEKLLTVIAILLNISITANISHSESYWAKTYGGSLEDRAHSIQRTADGGYIVAGYTESFGAGGFDMWVLKLNSTENVVWQKTFGGGANEYAVSVQQTTDGGYIVAGYTESFGAGGFDMWVLKLNSAGDVIWQKTYGSSANDYADSVQQTTDGSYIIAGLTEGSVCVVKLDGSGNVIWQNKYGGSNYDVNAMQQTSDGGVMLAGSFVFSSSYYNILPWIMKLNGNGDIVWQRFCPGSENLEPEGYITSIFQTADNGYIAVGGTDPYGLFNNDVLVFKLSQSGYISWAKIYRGASSATATSIRQTEDGNYIVAGSNSYRYVSGDFSWIQKLDSNGITLWQKTYRGDGGDYLDSVQKTEDGAHIALGDTNSFGAGDFDMWMLKVNDVGETPYCDIIGTSTIDVYDASHLSLNSDAMGQSIELTITDTNIIPQNTFNETSIICCYDSNDSDGDCIGDTCDTDPLVYDPSQPDTYPPGGNNCGDACECEGNFDNDADQDGTDAATFKLDFGRSPFNNPCDGVDLFVTGGSGTILHYDGSIWTQMETGTTQSLRDVWGTSEKDIFAVGGSASLHYNGTSWSPIAIDTNSYLLDVWGTGANDVFATGWDGDIFHYNGTSWTQMDSGGTYFLYGIWGSAGDDVFVASYDGFIYHYNGTSWESMTSGTTQDLYAVGGTSANDVFAIGGNGTILHYEGTSWEAMNSGTTDSLYEIWGAAPDDIYVVGSFGTILHYDGASWLPENSGTTTGLNGIWGSGPENIFAVGDQCTILHYDGANWSYVPDVPYVTSSLTGVWGISAPYCKGDFDCDNDVDGSDAALFKQDFGRSEFNNPCPACVVGEWCVYDIGGCEENCQAELDRCLLGCEELPPESRDVCNDNCVFDYQYNCIPACGT